MDITYPWSYEATQLIHDWIKDEFPLMRISAANDKHCKSFNPPKDADIIIGSLGEASIILYINQLDISIYIATPKIRSRIKDVNLINPESISGIKEVVRNLYIHSLSPWFNL